MESAQTDVITSSAGYVSGGYTGSKLNVIEKHNFASMGIPLIFQILRLPEERHQDNHQKVMDIPSGGYVSANSDVIDEFNFATGGDATDVGNLAVAGYAVCGTQV